MEATQTTSNHYSSSVKLVAGIFFTATGLVLTADNLDLVVAERYLRWWPVVLLVIGAMKLANPGSRVFGTVLTIAGAWILAYNLDWIHFTIIDLWPVILIGIGLMMVGRATGVVPDAKQALDFRNAEGLALFAARNIVNTSQDFRGSSLSAILGGYELDLTGANIAQSPAVIDLFVLWGGVGIYVPENWEIVGEVTPVMASFEVKTRGAGDPSKRLIVRGMVLMGGVEVKNGRTS